jgi:hypothetical protein
MLAYIHVDYAWHLQAEFRAKLATTDTVPSVPGLPEVIGNRKPLPDVDAPTFEGNNVADLEGLLPHEEVLEAKASMAMHWLLQHPKLCYMAHTCNDQASNHMYA